MIDVFTTLGDMLNPHQLPQKPKGQPGKPKSAEDYYTWNCTICGHPCAGPKNSHRVCMSCETAAKNLLDYDSQREIAEDLAEDRRQRDQDWMREYSHFSQD